MTIFQLVATLEASLPWALLGSLALALIAGGVLPKIGFRSGPALERPKWGGTEVVVVFLIYYAVLILAAGLLVGAGSRTPGQLFAIHAISQGTAIGLILLYVRRVHRQSWSAIGLTSLAPWCNLGATVLSLIVAFPVLGFVHALWILLLTSLFGEPPVAQQPVEQFEQAIAEGDRTIMVYTFLSAALVAPVGEELFFRGFLHRALRRQLSSGHALLLSSLAFALVHDYSVQLPIFCVGLLLGYVFERSGSLLYAILFHVLFNSIQLSQMLLPSS